MTSDPLAQMPTPARLWMACALCILPLGMVWSISPGSLMLGVFSTCAFTPGGSGVGPGYNTPDLSCMIVPVPTSAHVTHAVLGSQAPVRVFLVFAALVLAYAACHRRTAFTRRLVRAGTVATAVAAALAVADRAVVPCLCLLGGLSLVAPLVWPRPAVLVAARRAR